MNYTATVTSKGQITIPHMIRGLLDVSAGDLLVFTVRKPKEAVISPIKTDLLSLKGSVRAKKYVPLKIIREKLHYELGRKIASQGR